jgi:hypothetical protein
VKYWEIIADHLGEAGWSWGCSSHIDSAGRLPFTADAHRQNRKRFIVTADKKLTAFFELKGQCSMRMSLAPDFNFVTAISTLPSEISL